MLLNAPLMARLYVGISTLDRPTLAALLGNGGLFWFSGYPADLLSLYGSSFALQGKRASVPGGFPAEPVWTEVVGANPDHPGAFYHALMQQPNATLLAYFYELSNLDQKHQVFFTANAVRFKRFYTMFANLPKSKSPGILHDSSLTNLLRSVPLDDGGHVAFPGSPELWTVAKGHTTDNKKVAKMLQKVSRTATPDVEDEILLRLLETRDKTGYAKTTEFDNFLAVSNIDAHRRKPLD
jgi:hypothetical protein